LEKDGVEGGEGADTFGVSGKYSYNRGQASIIITHPARRSPKKVEYNNNDYQITDPFTTKAVQMIIDSH
jgi:hypothetical protein